MHISVIVPAYNEENRIVKSLIEIDNYLKDKFNTYEIIVIDDGSLDGTKRVVEGLKKDVPNLKIISNTKNTGKGYSVKKGVLSSRGELILFTDADLSTPIEELEKLKKELKNGFDIVIASRASKMSRVLKRQNIVREYMGKVFNFFVRLIVVKDFRDTQCGFKLFRRDAAMDIFERQKINGFSFDVEIIYLAKKLGYKIKDAPVAWINSPQSKVKMFSSSLDMLFDVLRMRRLHPDIHFIRNTEK